MGRYAKNKYSKRKIIIINWKNNGVEKKWVKKKKEEKDAYKFFMLLAFGVFFIYGR